MLNNDFQNFLNYLNFQKGYSNNTIQAYAKDLEQFNEFMQTKKYTYENIVEYLKFLKLQNYSSRTIVRKIACLKSYAKYLVLNDKIKTDFMENFPTPKYEVLFFDALLKDEIKIMLEYIQNKQSKNWQRDYIMVLFMFYTGVRVSELINLKISDLKLSEQMIIITGKGNKQRIVPLNDHLVNLLQEFIFENNYSQKYLFISNQNKQFTRQGIYKKIKQYTMQAVSKNATPHTLRHSFALNLINEGVDLRIIQALLGHQNLTSTQIYTKINDEYVRKMYEKYKPR